jgi:drug/metabolite transporter (DMT)-like permease
VIAGLAGVVIALALAVGIAIGVLALLDRRPLTYLLGGLLLVELAAVVQALATVVLLIRGERPVEPATFAGYALTTVLIAPLGGMWALSEKSKWGTGAAAVACLTVAVLTVRLNQTWR